MHDHLPATFTYLLVGHSAEITIGLIDEFDSSRRIGHPDNNGRHIRHNAESCFALAYSFSGLYLRRNIPKVAHEAIAPVRQSDTVQSPFIILRHPAVDPKFGPLRRQVGLARFERVSEDVHDLVGIAFLPEEMNHFVEVPADEIRNVAEHRPGNRVDLGDAEIGIHKVDTQRRLIEERFELLSLVADFLFRSLTLGDVVKERRHPAVVRRIVPHGEPPLPWRIECLYLGGDAFDHGAAQRERAWIIHRIGKGFIEHMLTDERRSVNALFGERPLGGDVEFGEAPACIDHLKTICDAAQDVGHLLCGFSSKTGHIKMRLHSREQLASTERLDEIVIGAVFQPFDSRFFAGSR